MPYAEIILNTPITGLEFSEEFKRKAMQLGFHSLTGLLEHQPSELLKFPGFGYRMLTEYISFMEKEKLGKYIMP
ncbi:hypothetical protein [Pedobacter jejuensis]|uniref:RNA polymerase alpha subunit C-terminal domain-containing protein n=1 Tax=Pedobacter jejuensis TaxID=1268550 RepID=A0A3N0C0M5_9SPHI|nr:hypothetical protein [Pedobacter jejuensis]RNL55570.1 hypothetical protein D7004_04480 [Pedobacter jejuensis]